MLVWLPLAGLAALLASAAMIDLRMRRIPNWLTAGVVLLYPLYLVVGPTPVAWLASVAIALGAFLLGIALFARAMIGGGDVKLIAGITLWAGPEHLLLFALVTSLAGGGLALIALWYQRWQGVIDAHLAAIGWSQAQTACAEGDAAGQASLDRLGLPYGVAIAAGGLAVLAQLLKL